MATLSAGSLNDGPSLAAGLDCEQTRCPMTHSDPLHQNHATRTRLSTYFDTVSDGDPAQCVHHVSVCFRLLIS